MPKAIFNGAAESAPGETEMHFGHVCVVQEDGSLVTEIGDDLFAIEVAAGRFRPMPNETKPKAKE